MRESSEKTVNNGLRFALLTQAPENYSSRRLIAAARKAGHAIEPIDVAQCGIIADETSGSVFTAHGALDGFHGVIPRIGSFITDHGCMILRHFEVRGATSLNTAQSFLRARDRIGAHQTFTVHGLAQPRTIAGGVNLDAHTMIAALGGAPLIIKLSPSSQGRGVLLAETVDEAARFIKAFRNTQTPFLLQEYIGEAAGTDLRLFVLGGEVIAAFRRRAKTGDFRANLHAGGAAELHVPTDAEIALACGATAALGLDCAGVDLLISRRGPLVLEVNPSPGLEGVETFTGVDVAARMIAHLETLCAAAETKKG
jgi:ribosomal protein S6--L-glutamate ligase